MHSKETVELLLAREEGMTIRESALFAGVPFRTAHG